MHVTDWAEAQKEDLMLSTVLDRLKAQKKTDLKALLAEHASSEEAGLSYGINRILQFTKEPYTCAQCLKLRLKIFYSMWSPGPIILLP